MKKTLLLVTSMIAISTLLATAQETFPAVRQMEHQNNADPHEHGGRIFTGGVVSFWKDTKAKTTDFDFCPEIGYLFNDTWGLGLMLGYEYEKKTEDNIKVISNGFKISPFARYYYLHRGPFNLYLDSGVGLNFAREKTGMEKQTRKGFEVGIRPGACVDLIEGLCLCLRMGFVGYRKDYFMGEEPKLGEKGFGFRFAPEELMIGLELEF